LAANMRIGMAGIEARPPRSKVLRAALVVGGLVTILVAALVDRVGIGIPGSFGSGQWLLLLVGLASMLAGFLGRRSVEVYRSLAILLLNTLALLAFLELGAIAIARSGILPSYRQTVLDSYPRVPYYAAQEWSGSFFPESRAAEAYQFRPYILWRHRPFSGDLVNVDSQGRRVTPGAQCTPEAYTVFTFGGSAMWGWGSPDWGTIPAYLQEGLDARLERPVCVENFGEDGFVSTQSLMALVLALQSGHVPDLVIFYHGANEVFAAIESGQAGNPVTLSTIAAIFERREHPLIQWMKSSRLYALATALTTRLNPTQPHDHVPMDAERLDDSVTEVYLSNYEIVAALAREYGFDFYFLWPPHLATGDKPLTPEEQAIKSRMDPGLRELAAEVHHDISNATREHEHLWDLASVFDQEGNQIWIDEWGHVTPEGNRLVAQKMITIMEGQLVDQ